MNFKIKLLQLLVGLLVVYFFFSLFEIYIVSALYKDQVEFFAMVPPEKPAYDYTFNLVKEACNYTSRIDFFIYSTITTPIVIIGLVYWQRRIRNNKVTV